MFIYSFKALIMESWLCGIVEKGKYINTLRYDVSSLCLATQQDNEASNAARQLVHPNQCHGYPFHKMCPKIWKRNIWSIAKIDHILRNIQTLYQNIYLQFLSNNVREDKVCWFYSNIAHVQISCVCQNQLSYLCV